MILNKLEKLKGKHLIDAIPKGFSSTHNIANKGFSSMRRVVTRLNFSCSLKGNRSQRRSPHEAKRNNSLLKILSNVYLKVKKDLQMRKEHLIKTLMLFVIFTCYTCQKPTVNQVIDFSDRKISFAIVNSQNETWDEAYYLAISKGISFISVDLDWKMLEPNNGNFSLEILQAINILFPADNLPVLLKIHPVNQNYKSFPSDIEHLDFNNEIVLKRFKNLLDTVRTHVSNANIYKICVGNEINTYLGDNKVLWAQFSDFFNQSKNYIKQTWNNDMEVSTTLTFDALVTASNEVNNLVQNMDYLAITYYPLNNDFTVQPVCSIDKHFDLMANFSVEKKIVLTECGYPSGLICNSNETLQSEFINKVFKNWDLHASKFEAIVFTWMTDYSENEIDKMINLLGYGNIQHFAEFREYLLTLGLRYADGNSKMAFETITQEIELRD
jgi:hypothetical protein